MTETCRRDACGRARGVCAALIRSALARRHNGLRHGIETTDLLSHSVSQIPYHHLSRVHPAICGSKNPKNG
jgi:hypothetical protein